MNTKRFVIAAIALSGSIGLTFPAYAQTGEGGSSKQDKKEQKLKDQKQKHRNLDEAPSGRTRSDTGSSSSSGSSSGGGSRQR
jgi:hypothetical protein